MAVLAIVEEMTFRSKLETAAAQLGVHLRVATDAASILAQAAGGGWERVILDLQLTSSDPLALLQALRRAQPALPIVGYCSHVERELQAQAQAAGCTQVVARSTLAQHLPAFLTGG